PSSGRFTQLDPLPKNFLTVDRYAYAGCNPANFTDPSGLANCSAPATFFAGVALVGNTIALASALIGLATTTGPIGLAAGLGAISRGVVTFGNLGGFLYCLGN
ncbi:MAG: hypothetical protein M3R24_41025, partial [Chloroflexota bacterium]|nr:hypothetical protein [Chloroflexota bacterium]